jgi:MFS family permease
MVLLGVGAGLSFPPMMTLSMAGVAPSDAGLASGLINTTGQIGGAIGLAVLATASTGRASALRASGSSALDALTGGYHLAFWIAAGLMLGAFAAAVLVIRPGAAQRADEVPVLIDAPDRSGRRRDDQPQLVNR